MSLSPMLNYYDNQILKKNLVKYLDKTGELLKIEHSAKAYKEELEQHTHNTFLAPLRLVVVLDFLVLAEISGEFVNLLIKEPYFAKKILTDVIETCCIVLAEVVEIRIFLQVRISSFPDFLPKLSARFTSSGISVAYGILSALSPIEKYTQLSLYKCEYRLCYTNDSVYDKDGICLTCQKKLIEIPKTKLTGERLHGLILDPKFLSLTLHMNRTQGISVEFTDELCVGLQIGMKYKLALVYEKNQYVAWGVHLILPESLIRSLSNVPLPLFPESISNLITNIREETHGSPWALVTAFAAHLASSLIPFSAFLHLKTALLLSLVSTCSRYPVPALVLGDCSVLIYEILKCAPRAITNPTSPRSLLLATHGVCLLQDSISLSYATTAVESEMVTINSAGSSKESTCATYPLRTSVWLCWNCNKRSGQDIHKLKTLIEIFGIPFLEEVDVNDEDVSSHLLQKAVCGEGTQNPKISEDDFQKFIDIISCQQVRMSPMASALIRNYFVASRQERPECLPLKSIKVLTGLSESYARLSLRDTVTYEDAVAAIYLYEESISVVYGPSMFSEQPKRAIATNDPVEIAQNMDNVLSRFSLWLSSYTKCHINNDSTQSASSP